MNNEVAERLIARLEALPNQTLGQGLMFSYFEQTPCGTVGCIAGETCLMLGAVARQEVDEKNGPAVAAMAQYALDLPNWDLFFVGRWPMNLQEEYMAVLGRTTLREERAVIIKAIRHFMQKYDGHQQ
jgi:hypothetical protein